MDSELAGLYRHKFRTFACRLGASGQFLKRLYERLTELEYDDSEIAFLMSWRAQFILLLGYSQQKESAEYPDVEVAMDEAENLFNEWRPCYDQVMSEIAAFVDTHQIDDAIIDKWLDGLGIWRDERQFKRNWREISDRIELRSIENGNP